MMKYNSDLSKQLAEELVDLWNDCHRRCDKIKNLVQQFKNK